MLLDVSVVAVCRCGNVAAILELDEHLQKNFTIFEAAPQVRLHTLVAFFFKSRSI